MRLPSPSDKIYAEVDGMVGHLVIDRPERKGALTLAMWQAIPTLVAALDAYPDVRVIVLRSVDGEAFSSGADIGEFAAERASAAGARAYEAACVQAFDAVASAAKPTLASLGGICFGGAFGLVAAADLRIAGASARFCIPAARLGTSYPPEAMVYIAGAIGAAAAKDLLFTGREIDATEAMSLGFLSRIVPDAKLVAETITLAESIARNAPLSIRASKQAIDAAIGLPHALDVRQVRASADRCLDSADYQEGIAAFLERRAPIFTGR